MQLWQYCLLVTAKLLYMFRTLSASIIRSVNNCRSSHWCMPWVGMIYCISSKDVQGRLPLQWQQDATLAELFISHCKITLHVSDAFCVHH